MIFDGLYTSLVFYDDIDKQNRYRDVCQAVCDYRQLFPLDFLPPFQIKTDEDDTAVLSYFYLMCENGELATDLFALFGRVNITTLEGIATYITGSASDTKDLINCGNYYLELAIENSSGTHTFYSECFSVVPGINNPTFQQQVFQPYCAWAWHDQEQKISENHAPCDHICSYYAISGNDALLPFQITVPTADNITSWTLIGTDCVFPLDPTILIAQPMGSKFNVIYNGDGIELPCGVFYSQIVVDGNTYYSEPIYISNDFQTNTTNYILQEDGDKLLQEDSFGLLHEP